MSWPWLRTPAATRLLDRLHADVVLQPGSITYVPPADDVERQQRERNEEIYLQYVRRNLDMAEGDH